MHRFESIEKWAPNMNANYEEDETEFENSIGDLDRRLEDLMYCRHREFKNSTLYYTASHTQSFRILMGVQCT